MDYKKKTIAAYDAHSEEYADYFKGLFEEYKRKEFGCFVEQISQGGRVLDLGCGSGEHSLYFIEQGLRVTGVDLSRGMVTMCRRKGLDVRLMDIERLEFNDNSFDGIWAVASLIHIPKKNIPRVAENISRILKHQGVLYVCVKEGAGEGFEQDRFEEGMERYFAYWTSEELNGVFREHFALESFERKKFKKTVFLQAFFKNRKLA